MVSHPVSQLYIGLHFFADILPLHVLTLILVDIARIV
jgi:hypothetical protein